MNHEIEEDEYEEEEYEGEDEYEGYWRTIEPQPKATPSGCLTGVTTAGAALLSMGGGAVAGILAIDALLQRQPQDMSLTLNLAAFSHALWLLLCGLACQGLLAFGLFTFQLHRQVRAMLPGMLLTGLVAALLTLIKLTA